MRTLAIAYTYIWVAEYALEVTDYETNHEGTGPSTDQLVSEP